MRTYAQLRSARDEEVIEQIDSTLAKVRPGTTLLTDIEKLSILTYTQLCVNELARREQDKQTQAMLEYTRTMKNLTWAIFVFTIINLVFVIASLVIAFRSPH